MGEVYRARDTRLARDVAIKVLPESLACDQERLRRFEKEARSASALNHPNIVTIHDIGSEGGVSYIAMELVDGATLRELLATRPACRSRGCCRSRPRSRKVLPARTRPESCTGT